MAIWQLKLTPIFQLYFATSFKCALFLNVFVKNIVLRKKYCAIFYYCDINFASNQSLSYQLLTFDIFCYCKQFPICAFLWGHPRAINQLHPNHLSFMWRPEPMLARTHTMPARGSFT